MFIQKIMFRNRFLEILKLIRFDDKNARRRRLVSNRFALISDVWYRFIHNCQLAYTPNAYLTVDKQLFLTKVRCQLTQFMPNKPNKFGIKFWLLVDAQSTHVVNGFPYLCKDDEKLGNMQLSEYVAKRLMTESFLNEGYNVTCDNFFTSKILCDLLKNKTSLLGTIRINRLEMPQNLKQIMQSHNLHESTIIQSDTCTLTSYKCKKKFATVLSSLQQQQQQPFILTRLFFPVYWG